MWAIATGNSALEGLGRLQTGVVKRSINEYFLLEDSNTNHPADFVKNKVTKQTFFNIGAYTYRVECVAPERHILLYYV